MPRPKLSKSEYVQSVEIAGRGYQFYALIAAAMRQADSDNLASLKALFPGIHESLVEWRKKPIWPLGVN